MDKAEKALVSAVLWNQPVRVQSLLATTPTLNVNYRPENGNTVLHTVAWYGRTEILKHLLAHPAIDVNPLTRAGRTPLHHCCTTGEVEAVKLLLKDPRVRLLQDPDNLTQTPLWLAAFAGRLEAIRWIIALRPHEMELGLASVSTLDDQEYMPRQIAWRSQRHDVVELLDKFAANPTLTRHEIRLGLQIPEALAAEIFAQVVFLCDNLLRVVPAEGKQSVQASEGAVRFFAMALQLPMELQMVLCHRVSGSMRENITTHDAEIAFTHLALRGGIENV